MQIKKDDVKAVIVQAAKEEFLKSGFQKASLRDIASRAGVTKGNIYTYFKNKDELFCSIVRPALKYMREYMRYGGGDEFIRNYGMDLETSEKASIDSLLGFIRKMFQYRDELKLLFFSSAGSGYSGFKEDIYDMYTESSNYFFGKWAEHNPDYRVNVSEMMIHSFASLYISFIEELLVHEPDEEALEVYITQVAKFVYAGTTKLMISEKTWRK